MTSFIKSLSALHKTLIRMHSQVSMQNIFRVIRGWGPWLEQALERCAYRFSCLPLPFFYALGWVHFNHWITKIYYRAALGMLHVIFLLPASSDLIYVAKQHVARARELSFVKPSDWLWANIRYYMMRDRVDVVLAHYKEDLQWLAPFLAKIDHLYLYCKHQEHCTNTLPTDHRGARSLYSTCQMKVAAYTYLSHIMLYYT